MTLIWTELILGQENSPAVLLEIQYGYQKPVFDLDFRFGGAYSLGSRVSLFNKKKYSLGLEYQFIFGSRIKEDVLLPLRTEDGSIITNSLQPHTFGPFFQPKPLSKHKMDHVSP